jgi:hypothetical protein
MHMTPHPVRGTTTRQPGIDGSKRIAAGVVAAGAVVGLFAGAGSAAATPMAPPGPHKSYVCKYVGKPGVDERLQTGNNPIFIDNHALLGYNGTVTVGQEFKDRQGRSVVIVANTERLNPEPTVADCPPPTPPTPPTTTATFVPPTTTATFVPPTTTATFVPPTTTATFVPPTTTATFVPPTTTATFVPPTTTATFVPPTTTATFVPPTTTATFVPPTTSTSTTTGAVVTPTATSTTATETSFYPLEPVNGGVSKDGTAREVLVTPLRAALVLLVLLALWVVFGGRVPHITKVRTPKDGS